MYFFLVSGLDYLKRVALGRGTHDLSISNILATAQAYYALFAATVVAPGRCEHTLI